MSYINWIMMPSSEISTVLQRGVATRTRAFCRRSHKRTIAAAITGALPSSQSSTNDRYKAINCIPHLNYSSQGNHASFIKSAPTASIDKSNFPFPKMTRHGIQIRTFRTVGDYHNVADETLNNIQDAVEDYLEDNYDAGVAEKEEDIPEVNYASGVLTLYLPPNGTWIINKQTPNQQLWWSSPISGPKRYEYDEEKKRWVYSRVVDEGGKGGAEVNYGEEDTLEGILNKEVEELFGEGLGSDFSSLR